LVRQLVAEQPDITLAEIKAVLATEKVTVGRRSPDFCNDSCALKTHLGQRPPLGVETVEAYPHGGRERPTAFWWHATPQENMVHGLLRA
jgi:hypothetical protein